jgi:hypothetical protein
MTFERSNKVTNVKRTKFIELVLNVFQLLTLKKLYYAITRIIKQVTCHKVLLALRKIKKTFASRM